MSELLFPLRYLIPSCSAGDKETGVWRHRGVLHPLPVNQSVSPAHPGGVLFSCELTERFLTPDTSLTLHVTDQTEQGGFLSLVGLQ